MVSFSDETVVVKELILFERRGGSVSDDDGIRLAIGGRLGRVGASVSEDDGMWLEISGRVMRKRAMSSLRALGSIIRCCRFTLSRLRMHLVCCLLMYFVSFLARFEPFRFEREFAPCRTREDPLRLTCERLSLGGFAPKIR